LSNAILAIDIGTTNVISIIAKNDFNNKINILGTGIEPSEGIDKGSIRDIEAASMTIKRAVDSAKRSTNETIESTFVSISGTYTKSLRSSGSVNIPNGHITQNEINQVLQMALYNATIVPEYDVVHVLPIFFKVDDANSVGNPLNMNGSRLEVSIYIVTAKKTALTNIKNACKNAGIEVTNFVLSGYVSAISVLDDEQKRLGVGVIDLGASTTDLVVYKGKSIIYNDFLPVGSKNITNDLSVMLHTPQTAAEMLKKEYGTLLPIDKESSGSIKRVKIPIIGDEQNTKEMALDLVQTIIHARAEETLILISEELKKSGIHDILGAGIVLTGGMSQLPGIKELTSKIFTNMPIKVANPVNIKNGYINFDDPAMSTIVGLLMYGLDTNPSFELDSNKKLRKKVEIKSIHDQEQALDHSTIDESRQTQHTVQRDEVLLPTIDKKDGNKGMSKFWKKVSEWF